MTPKLTRSSYVLAVPNLKASAAFYRDVLGFSVRDMAPGWLFFERDGCRIMAGECRDAIPPKDLGDHSYFAYLHVEGIDALHEAVRAKGAELIKPLRDESWGMGEFGVRTADGHRIMFGAEIRA